VNEQLQSQLQPQGNTARAAVLGSTLSTKEMLMRMVNIGKFHTLNAGIELRAINSTAEITIQNKGGIAWVTDISTVIRDVSGINILEADRRGEIPLDDLRVFINIDGTDFTDKSIPIQALSTRDDHRDLHSGFRIPSNAKILLRFESKQLASGTFCKYPLRIDITLKYYELQP
jgi:hypothetical protein